MHVLAVVQRLGQAFRRNHVEVLGLLRELGDVVVGALAHTAAKHFAGKERNVVSETQVSDDAVVNRLHLGGPLAITGIGFALVEDDSLDDAYFLGLFGHFDQAFIRLATVGIDLLREPASLLTHVALVKRRIK